MLWFLIRFCCFYEFSLLRKYDLLKIFSQSSSAFYSTFHAQKSKYCDRFNVSNVKGGLRKIFPELISSTSNMFHERQQHNVLKTSSQILRKNIHLFQTLKKKCYKILVRPPRWTPKNQKWPPVFLKEHPALQNMKCPNFSLFVTLLSLLDPDPLTQFNSNPITIRIYCKKSPISLLKRQNKTGLRILLLNLFIQVCNWNLCEQKQDVKNPPKIMKFGKVPLQPSLPMRLATTVRNFLWFPFTSGKSTGGQNAKHTSLYILTRVATEAETQLVIGTCDVSGLMLQNASYAKLKYIILWKSKYTVSVPNTYSAFLEQKSWCQYNITRIFRSSAWSLAVVSCRKAEILYAHVFLLVPLSRICQSWWRWTQHTKKIQVSKHMTTSTTSRSLQ